MHLLLAHWPYCHSFLDHLLWSVGRLLDDLL